jgi:hypothetical protein
MNKTITFLLFFFLFLQNSYSDLKIKSWSQKNIFTSYGQEVEIILELKAENLERDYYYNSWSFIFDERERINIIEANSITDQKHYSFGDNRLKIDFNKLFNNQTVKIKIKYQEFNDEIKKTPYIRRECVQIPQFAEGANSSLTVKALDNMDVYSLNDKFRRSENTYKWIGTVNKKGFRDCFEMTEKEAKWEVSSIFVARANSDFKKLKVNLPLNFIGGNNEILKYTISTNQGDKVYTIDDLQNKSNTTIEFKNFFSHEAVVEINAIIKNNYNNFYWVNNFDIEKTLEIKEEYVDPYNSLINQIQNSDKSNLPTHIKIAKWVNENVVYTESFVGKKMSSMEILQTRRGVCEHYSILYQDLLRSIGIPAITVSGISYDYKKNKFENHAWVIINYNSQWIPIDPTWGIYSGKLPISHIFMYNNNKNSIEFWFPGSVQNVTSDIINTAKFLGIH